MYFGGVSSQDSFLKKRVSKEILFSEGIGWIGMVNL